jgi:formate dehydrogenase subunit gamma
MSGNRGFRTVIQLVLLMFFASVANGVWAAESSRAAEQAERQQSQPLNNAPFWRDVRAGQANPYQTTTVRGIETSVLVQTQGEIWRQIRNGPVTVYGGWLLVAVFLLIGLFYAVKGPIRLQSAPTGRQIERFSGWERVVHWTTAVTFVVLAVTGIVILFGRYILLPVTGYSAFSWLAVISKTLHNFIGPLFAAGIILMFVTFVKDNLPRAYDWIWVKKAGGMLRSGSHVPSGKFNAGEKGWFWAGVTVLGIAVCASGFILLFPNFEQGRVAMQQAHVIHAIAALLFIAMSFGHIYMGTLGVEGAYDSMRTGHVDETWAKEHHEYWYDEVKAGRIPGGAPSTAPAAPLREGWRL